MALLIDLCQICRNRAELTEFKSDGRKICGECMVTMNEGVKRNDEKKPGPQLVEDREIRAEGGRTESRRTEAVEELDPEREAYLAIIADAAKKNPKWVEKFIKEVVAKKVLKYDWLRVIENERWFSLLDLRRFAIELDPSIEFGASEEAPEHEEEATDDEKPETETDK